jgi:hypothetical protein
MHLRFFFFGALSLSVGAAAVVACVSDEGNTIVAPVTDGGSTGDGSTSMSTTDGATTTSDAGTDATTSSVDAGDAAPIDPEAVPKNLAMQGLLALWMEASSDHLVISGGNVANWNDLSGNNNTANGTASGLVPKEAGVNGHSTVVFNSYTSLFTIPDNASLQMGQDEFFIIGVARQGIPAGGPTSAYFFSKAKYGGGIVGGPAQYKSGLELFTHGPNTFDGGIDLSFQQTTAAGNVSGDETGSAIFDDGKFHLVGLRHAKAGAHPYTFYIDSTSQPSSVSPEDNESEPEAGVKFGAYPAYPGNLAYDFDFEMAELIVAHKNNYAISDANVAALVDYMRKKYGL